MTIVKLGNCYESSWKLHSKKYPVLVHGIVTGSAGKIKGKKFGHAWLEFENGISFCYDAELDQLFPLELYYRAGKIEYTRKYSLWLAVKESTIHGTYGPWDSKIFKVDDKTLKELKN